MNMKQEIVRYSNDNIRYIINRNNSGQWHGLVIEYNHDGSIWYIRNYFNGKRIGLETYKPYSNEIYQSYFL